MYGIDINHVTKVAQQVIKQYAPSCKKNDLYGFCGVLTFHFWNTLGKPKEYWPYSVMVGGEEHVILYNKKEDTALDISGNQFDLPLLVINPKFEYDEFYRLRISEIKNLIRA